MYLYEIFLQFQIKGYCVILRYVPVYHTLQYRTYFMGESWDNEGDIENDENLFLQQKNSTSGIMKYVTNIQMQFLHKKKKFRCIK